MFGGESTNQDLLTEIGTNIKNVVSPYVESTAKGMILKEYNRLAMARGMLAGMPRSNIEVQSLIATNENLADRFQSLIISDNPSMSDLASLLPAVEYNIYRTNSLWDSLGKAGSPVTPWDYSSGVTGFFRNLPWWGWALGIGGLLLILKRSKFYGKNKKKT